MRTAKQRRELILKDRPLIRRMVFDDAEGHRRDMGILWEAHQSGSFGLPEMDQAQFNETMLDIVLQFDSAWIVEDRSQYHKDRGPVALILVKSDGVVIRPYVDYFAWASRRNVVRTTVAFLNWVRYSRDVAVCIFGCTPQTKPLYWRMRELGIQVTHLGDDVFALRGDKRLEVWDIEKRTVH